MLDRQEYLLRWNAVMEVVDLVSRLVHFAPMEVKNLCHEGLGNKTTPDGIRS